MRKTKFWILGIILALVYSCSDDFESVERSPQEIEVSEARAYFEKYATDLAPLTFKDPLSRSMESCCAGVDPGVGSRDLF